ncbi:MAG: radical SAM protein [Euryarchaeota archaeon]|nr:radical SAM protein [Euryarchaeota archaeon]MBU4138354.1 radical SAM protein [Euryarchaeota archaeon]
MEYDITGSFYNHLTEGCRLCYKGAKMVLFVTGMCGKKCFYCPVSEERREKDVIFANERRVEKDEDIIEEALSMEALGTGITGGEPLLRLDRVVHYIRLLKNRFGSSHHIHLYTALVPNMAALESLRKAGLDEIRFHPPHNMWKDINHSIYGSPIRWAHKLGISAGIEIPSIASDFSGILSLLDEVDGFLNLNELEFSETNMEGMKKQGYEVASDESCEAKGSREVAEALNGKKVHFCSSRFKDAVQLRERYKRIANKNARGFDEITEDGTIIYGVIEGCSPDIMKEAGVMEDNTYVVTDVSIETESSLVRALAEEIKKRGGSACIIERYPMKNGMVVERTPL